ncbi:MAG TPA: hypothetical protein DCQ30_07505, partial [Acidimicrobiaceae bacterium]|nr:hypothetical protein [Acidimicrobiaceae bacterium]
MNGVPPPPGADGVVGGPSGAHGGGNEPQLHQALGLSDDEAARIEDILGRPPNHLELAMYAVMWSEH